MCWTPGRCDTMSSQPLRPGETDLRFLILLSAMIAGLTGLVVGAPARAHEPAAIAATASAAADQVVAARTARPLQTVGASSVPAWVGGDDRIVPQLHKVDERRIE